MKRILLLITILILALPPVGVFAADYIPINVDLADPIGEDANVKSGWYALIPQCAPKRAVTIQNGSRVPEANAYLFKFSSAEKQYFYIKKRSDGTYTIKNKRSGLVLEPENGGNANKTNVQQAVYTNDEYQRWFITKKNGWYVFQSAVSTKVLSVASSKNENRANVRLFKYAGFKGQKFSLKKLSTSSANRKYKVSKRKWSDSRDYEILTNIIGAVESGGQVYGNRDYASYAGPYANTANEVTITLGWAQFYGAEGQRLIQNIYKKNPKAFKKIDKKGSIKKALKKNWVSSRWNPSSSQKKILIKLITSSIGKKCQDELFQSYMVGFVNDCKSAYTSNAWAIHMYCQIRHLGGPSAAKRIFDRCKGDYSLDSIMKSLKKDQSDGSSSNQVGDRLFWSRHEKCCEFLQKYAA